MTASMSSLLVAVSLLTSAVKPGERPPAAGGSHFAAAASSLRRFVKRPSSM